MTQSTRPKQIELDTCECGAPKAAPFALCRECRAHITPLERELYAALEQHFPNKVA